MKNLQKPDLIFPELSYEIIGTCFNVYNQLGFGHKEKYYHNAIEIELKNRKIAFKSQVRTNLFYKENKIGTYVFDLIIDNKVVVELKVGTHFKSQDYKQLKSYLIQSGLGLGLLVRFDDRGVTFSRVLPPSFVDL